MRLQEAAKEIGVSAITLKRWFLNCKVADVQRDRNNWRIFTPADIERIKNFYLQTAESESSRLTARAAHRVASFFSGIGGFDLGFESAGFEVSMQCEIRPFCNSILKKNCRMFLDSLIFES